jgi:hypothetical protein
VQAKNQISNYLSARAIDKKRKQAKDLAADINEKFGFNKMQ